MHRRVPFWPLSIALVTSVWFCTQLVAPAMAQDLVRAKVGIGILRPGDPIASAKTTEMVKKGNSVRIYVVPENDAYIYVVQHDGKTPTLLNASNAATKISKGSPVMLPGPETFYTVDGESDKESITVICSPTEIREVAKLFSTSNVAQKNWLSLEKELVDKSKIELSQQADKPLQIAGNVRSMNPDPFLETLLIFSGKSLVVKKYDFQVQK
jgi:hypothetical protein